MVEHEVCGGRLNIGGRWYFNGQHVQLNDADAKIYAMRGLTRPVVVQKKPPEPEAARETIPPGEVGVQLKKEDSPAPLSEKNTGLAKELMDGQVMAGPTPEQTAGKELGSGKPRRTNR